MKRVFGVGGELESGKDTFSDYLVENHDYTKMAFAKNLKQACMEVFGLSEKECYTEEGKKREFSQPFSFRTDHAVQLAKWLVDNGKWEVTGKQVFEMYDFARKKSVLFTSARHILQFVGTELWRDHINEDIHAEMLFKEAKEKGIEKLVICDCRFDNERAFVKKEGGELILIKNPQLDCPVVEQNKEPVHRSESSLGDDSEYEVVITNTKDGLEKFYNKIKFAMERRI